jgi:hypothetical protein
MVRYNSDNCYADDENYVDIKYKFGSKYTTERVYIKNQVHTSLTGLILDSQTNEPVPYARVTLIPSGKSATSSKNGLYVFNDLPNGNYSVQVMKRGYATVESTAMVSADATTRTDIVVDRVPVSTYTPDGNVETTIAPAPTAVPAAETKPAKNPTNVVRNGL